MIAVASGSPPRTIPPWLAGTVSIPKAVRSGKPKEMPDAVIISFFVSLQEGSGWRVATRMPTAATAATVVRPRPISQTER
jgi:hypothetical protein